MKKETVFIYFFSLGLLLTTITIIWCLINLNTNYYSNVKYNNLPIIDKPEAIQHYENARDESVQQTEQHITEQNLANVNGTVNVIIFKNAITLRKEDGSINILFLVILSSMIFIFYQVGLPFEILRIRTYHNFLTSFIVAAGFIFIMNVFLSGVR